MDADDWDRRYADAEMVWSATPNAFFAEAVEGLSPARALDLGAGEGRNAIWLASQGWDVTAVDFSRVAIDKGRRLATDRGVEVRWLVEDVTTWPPSPHAFDLVCVIYVHFPADERQALLRSSAAGVATGGTWVWVGHDADNIEHGYGGPQDPAVLASVDELVAALEPGRWEVTRAEQVLRTVAREAGHGEEGASPERTAIDQLVVARRLV